jgi:hypothetical protein
VGPPINRAWRGVKAARGEVLPHKGGGKRAGHDRLAASWAERVGEAGREAESQWGEGQRASWGKKRKWAMAWPKTGAGPNSRNKTFSNFI